jgi:hypothetical protein
LVLFFPLPLFTVSFCGPRCDPKGEQELRERECHAGLYLQRMADGSACWWQCRNNYGKASKVRYS